MEKLKFNQKEYKQNYDKQNYTRITFVLKKDEAEDFKNELKSEKVGISEFLKKCVKNFKEINKNY